MPLDNLLYPRQMGYSIGMLYTDTFMGIVLNNKAHHRCRYYLLYTLQSGQGIFVLQKKYSSER